MTGLTSVGYHNGRIRGNSVPIFSIRAIPNEEFPSGSVPVTLKVDKQGIAAASVGSTGMGDVVTCV